MDSSDIMSMDKAKRLCEIKGLVPMEVIGTRKVQLSKGNRPTLRPITWDEFEIRLKERNLALYSKFGWIKIMQDTRKQ